MHISMASKKMSYFLPLLFLSIKIFSCITQANNTTVPANETFHFVNEGKYFEHMLSDVGTYLPLDTIVPSAGPFELCFYNTTPAAFTLAIRMGFLFSHVVWEANHGSPLVKIPPLHSGLMETLFLHKLMVSLYGNLTRLTKVWSA